MIGKHRIRRSTSQPQAGSVGAPFKGVFIVEGEVNLQEGVFEVRARYSAGGLNINEPLEAWDEGKNVDLNAFEIIRNGVRVMPSSAIVNSGGREIAIFIQANATTIEARAIPGHPGLISKTGLQCGGTYVEA